MSNFDVSFPDDLMETLEQLSDEEQLCTDMLEAAGPILERSVIAASSSHVSEPEGGDMLHSIKTTKPKKGKTAWHLTVRPTGTDRKGVRNMEKMAYLEYGTSKQPATPVLSPAVRQAESGCIMAMQKVFDEALTT